MAVLFPIVCASLVWLIGSALWSILVPERRTWPPLRREGLLYHVNGFLGPAINFGLVALALLGRDSFVFDHWLRFPVGAMLFGVGAYFSLAGVFGLGMRRTQGYEGALLDTGPYRYSRNPQYVGAVLGYLGLNLVCNSAPGLAATALASAWLLALPFAEEPWLREKLGADYAAYAARVPRYLTFGGEGRVRCVVEVAFATVLGASIVSLLQEQPRLVAGVLAALALSYLLRKGSATSRRTAMTEGFLLVTVGVIGYLTEAWGTSNGHWSYRHVPPPATVPPWVPVAWALAGALLDRLDTRLVDAQASLPRRLAIAAACGMLLPLLGEALCIANGVWSYHWPLQIFGVPLGALLLIAYAHVTFLLMRAGLTELDR